MSAALLFMVQPLFAKALLPLLGGASAVWVTLMFVYQALLLLGYGYAHALSHWIPEKWQVPTHFILLFASFCWLSFLQTHTLTPPTGPMPLGWLIGTALGLIGVPFFVLSATSPLLQHWFAHTLYTENKNPYTLYSISNIGSFIALLGYPFLLERFLELKTQGWVWQAGYVIFALLITACGILHHHKPTSSVHHIETPKTHLQFRVIFQWLTLSFVPASLLLGVTSFTTTQITSVPLLWVIPLALYLLSFSIAFAHKPLLSQKHIRQSTSLVFGSLCLFNLAFGAYAGLSIAWHLITFFILALGLHQLLAILKPPKKYLTTFYFTLSLGGVLGGGFNAIIAPLFFNGAYEYPLMLLMAALLLLPLQKQLWHEVYGSKWLATLLSRTLDVGLPLLFALILFLPGKTLYVGPYVAHITMPWPLWVTFIGLFIMVLLSLDRPFRLGLTATLFLLGQILTPLLNQDHITTKRSFYGTYSVIFDASKLATSLISQGSSARQGSQSIEPEKALDTTFFYNFAGFKQHLPQQLFEKPWVSAGLGVGTIACLSVPTQPNHKTTFIEIDPVVINIAQNAEYFTYLQKCPGKNITLQGDGRHQLKTTAQDRTLGILFLDTFSGASIPTHMLTQEAFKEYLQKLSPEGVIAVNITNTHLDLLPLLSKQAETLGLTGLYTGFTPRYKSTWVILAQNKESLGTLAQDPDWSPLPKAPSSLRPWTDSFATILPLLK